MASLPSCLSRVRFGAFLAYSPRGQSEESAKSRRITYAIKNVKAGIIAAAVKKLRAEMQPGGRAHMLSEVLGEDVLVVPCPRSAPLVKGALWPPKEICDELVRQGLAARTAAILERKTAVPKSSTAAVGERPKPAAHIRSMSVVRQLQFVPQRITVVDDVITRGATLIAAASHLQHQFPEAQVRIFALVRTKGLDPEVTKIIEPVLGEVSFNGVDADRNP